MATTEFRYDDAPMVDDRGVGWGFVRERGAVVAEPGGRMLYSTGNYHMLSAILTAATGRSTLEYARRAGVTIYAVGLQLPEGSARSALAAIAEETGGQSYFVKNAEELSSIYRAIEGEMRSQYLLAYEPTNPEKDGSYRRIEIQLINQELAKQKVKLTHRQGYFAKSAGKK